MSKSIGRRTIILYIVVHLRGILMGIFFSVFPLYAISLRISIFDWGILVTAYGVGMLLSEAGWGLISDTINAETLIPLTMFFLSLLSIFYAFFIGFYAFLILQLLRGVFSVALAPISRSFISRETSSDMWGTTMGLWYSANLLGQSIGSIGGAYIVEKVTFKYSFFMAAAATFLGFLISSIGFRHFRGILPHNSHSNPINYTERLKMGLFNKQLLLIYSLGAILLAGHTLVTSFLPVYAIEKFRVAATDIGLIILFFNLTCVMTAPLIGKVANRIGIRKVIFIGLFAYGLTSFMYTLTASFWQLLIATIFAALSFSIVAPSLLALMTKNATVELFGLGMGLFGTFEDIGIVLSSLIYGVLWSFYGPAFIFLIGGIIQIIGAYVASRAHAK